MNPYEVLGLNKDASPEEIKKAYRKKSFECHPDKGGDKNEFTLLNLANEILSDPEKRSRYDSGESVVSINKASSLKETVVGVLNALFIQVCEQTHSVEHTDIIGRMRQHLESAIKSARNEIEKCERFAQKFEKVVSRIKGTGTENFLSAAAQSKAKDLRESIKVHQDVIHKTEKCLEMLAEYSYEFTANPNPYNDPFAVLRSQIVTFGEPI